MVTKYLRSGFPKIFFFVVVVNPVYFTTGDDDGCRVAVVGFVFLKVS